LCFVQLLANQPAAAKTVALEALALARKMEHVYYEASALANLGQAERDLGDLGAAAEHMSAGLAIRRAKSQPADYVDDIANLAFVRLLAGDVDAARPLADEMWPVFESTSSAVFMPQFAYWMAAQVYRGLGDLERGAAMLHRANETVKQQASLIRSSAERERFLALDAHREIAGAVEHDRWPTIGAGRADSTPQRSRRSGSRRAPKSSRAGDEARPTVDVTGKNGG